MIDYGKPPENQMQMEIPGMTDKGYERYVEARDFSLMHRDLWFDYLHVVEQDMGTWPDGKASPNDCLMLFKRKNRARLKRQGCVLRDNMAAALARVAHEENPRKYRFRFAKSDSDGFVGVRL